MQARPVFLSDYSGYSEVVMLETAQLSQDSPLITSALMSWNSKTTMLSSLVRLFPAIA